MACIPIFECVPNFSEGRDLVVVDQIVNCFRGKEGLKLLDYSCDSDHNRMVVTVAGQAEPLKQAIIQSVGEAIRHIDLTRHQGRHPRMGAADVIPFIPLQNATMEDAVELARQVGQQLAERYDLPVYLYEEAASASHRRNLADVRRGEFEGLTAKLADLLWKPDFGPDKPHPTAGAVIVGARPFLIAYNINLDTDRLEVAKAIAKRIRFCSGGLPYCKAIGLMLDSRQVVQVSINLTNPTSTGLHQVFDLVSEEAAKYQVAVLNSELIGLIPLQALTDVAAHYLKLEGLSVHQVLEYRLWE
jgi:glutamate formiminotransferase